MPTVYLETAAVLEAVAAILGEPAEQLYSRVRLHQLEAALDRPGHRVGGAELYRSMPEKLTAMVEGMMTARPFPRGNALAAAIAMQMLAGVNGFELRIRDQTDADDLARHLASVAADPEALLGWVGDRLKAMEPPDTLPSEPELLLFVAEPMTTARTERVARVVEALPGAAIRAAEQFELGLRPALHIPSAWQHDGRDAVAIYDMDQRVFERMAGLIVVQEQGSCGSGVNASWALDAALPMLLLHPVGGPPASPLLAGQAGLMTVAEYRDDAAHFAADLEKGFATWYQRSGLDLADARRRRANVMFRMVGLQVALRQAWAGKDVIERAIAAEAARLAPRRVNLLLTSLAALSTASGMDLLSLGTALGVDAGRWLSVSPAVPSRPAASARRRMTVREKQALSEAQSRHQWPTSVVRALVQEALREAEAPVSRRFRLDTVAGWELLHQRLFP